MGNAKYLDHAASVISSFNQSLAVKNGFVGLSDITSTNSDYLGRMESFWLTEVLKYLYVVFVSHFEVAYTVVGTSPLMTPDI